jgi:cyanophycin synthetase
MTKKKDIEFLRVSHLRGPNIWTYRPVLEVWVDIGELEDFPSNLIPGLYERLLAWLPTLVEHRCGVGERGGFLQRLRDGTWAGHILEHVVLELQSLAGMRTGFGKARQTGQRGIYKVVFRTREEKVGRAALAAGRDLLMAAINDTPYDVAATVTTLQEMVDRHCLGPSTAAIVDAATERGIPHLRLNEGNLVQLGYGARQRRIWTAETDQTSAIAESVSRDKDLTKSLLHSCGIPVPQGRTADSRADAWAAAQEIGLPVAVKPVDGNHGRGVALDVTTREGVEAAYDLALENGSGVIVEQFIPGNEHRLLVVGRRMIAAAGGEAAWVAGDGKSRVTQLIDSQLNVDPRRGDGEEFPLNRLDVVEQPEIGLELGRQGLTPDSVPEAGRRVLVLRNGNVAFDVTDRVHPEVAHAACLAARVVGLDIAGVDLVAEDISRPLREQRGAIIEVNAGPGLLAHMKPATGKPRPVGEAIIDHLIGAGESGRIPIVGVAGSRGTSLVARLVAWLLQASGRYVGLACADGLFLDQRQVDRSDCVHWEAGQRLLINRTVDAAVIENNSRMILSEGLAYDRCTVGIVTDVHGPEALADFHIDTPDQVATVLRTQVDVVLPEGVAVLNAGDPMVAGMAPLCDGEVLFYGLDPTEDVIARHRDDGGRVAFLRESTIVLAKGAEETALLPLSSLKPSKAAQPESVLAAVAAAWALGIGPVLIAAALRSYNSDSAAGVSL